MVLNLPPILCQKAENIILCGLWYGPNKPNPRNLLDPVLKHVHNLYETGFVMQSSNGQTQLCKQSVNGVKGVSPLSSFIDLVCDIPIDYMHCVLSKLEMSCQV